ncbi:MAG: hypothetical protein WBA57_14290 [Elainellaceae cyanobacterium]
MTVEIDSTLFDRIERYLEAQLPDGEAAAILQALEDAEIIRTAQAYRLDASQPGIYRVEPPEHDPLESNN